MKPSASRETLPRRMLSSSSPKITGDAPSCSFKRNKACPRRRSIVLPSARNETPRCARFDAQATELWRWHHRVNRSGVDQEFQPHTAPGFCWIRDACHDRGETHGAAFPQVSVVSVRWWVNLSIMCALSPHPDVGSRHRPATPRLQGLPNRATWNNSNFDEVELAD